MITSNPYIRFRQAFDRKLNEIGESIKIVKLISSEYDPTKSEVVTIKENYISKGLRMNFKSYDVASGLVRKEDVNFYISPISSLEGSDVDIDTPYPDPTDTIEFLNESYSVINVSPWNHVGILIGYKVHARVIK